MSGPENPWEHSRTDEDGAKKFFRGFIIGILVAIPMWVAAGCAIWWAWRSLSVFQ